MKLGYERIFIVIILEINSVKYILKNLLIQELYIFKINVFNSWIKIKKTFM